MQYAYVLMGCLVILAIAVAAIVAIVLNVRKSPL